MNPYGKKLKAIKKAGLKKNGLGQCQNCNKTIYPHESHTSCLIDGEVKLMCLDDKNMFVAHVEPFLFLLEGLL